MHKRKLILIAHTLICFFSLYETNAQCPQNGNCTPGLTQDLFAGNGIFNVTLNTINNTSAGVSEGYKDFSCTQSTSLTVGIPYSVTVKTGDTYNENVKVWIDYNNDGNFSTDELAFSSNNLKVHSGNIIIPSTAILNTPLRMRVGADFQSPLANACSTPKYSQVEDYSIIALTNGMSPIAKIYTQDTITCSGIVHFQDHSLNVPTSWKWYFGDGDSSSLQNPTHTYKTEGQYNVFLKVTNQAGIDSITENNLVTVNGKTPINSTCTPNTNNNCCGYGIYKVILNAINHSSNDGSEGYQDFTCNNRTTLTIGKKYQMTIQVNASLEEDIKVWIDYNNDGGFNNQNELILDLKRAMGSVVTTFTVSSGTENKPLRMRVMSDYTGQNIDACTNVEHGQAEDYTITLISNQSTPITLYDVDNTANCTGQFVFTDKSDNSPNKWFWDFGDGSISTSQNPTHTYTNYGKYNVKLKSCNNNGCDSLIKPQYVNYIQNCKYCTPLYIYNYYNYISSTKLNTLNNTSGNPNNGYSDYTSTLQTDLEIGETYSIDLTGNGFNTSYFYVWIDYDRSGKFDNNELILNIYGSSASKKILIPTNIQTGNTRMRVIVSQYSLNEACGISSYIYGEVEDYAINLIPSTLPPKIDFQVHNQNLCYGRAIFSDSSSRKPTSWFWDFGDGGISFAKNPTHIYTQSGTYTVKLKACNNIGCDSLTKPNYVSYTAGQPCNYCIPSTMYTSQELISSILINSTSNLSGNTTTGYTYYNNLNIHLESGKNYNLDVNTAPGYTNYGLYSVWIDYGQDGSFDASDEVYIGNYGYSSITIPVQIPNNIPIGKTTMRIKITPSYLSSSVYQPCSDINYGEVEDYTIYIDPNTAAPETNFKSANQFNCTGYASFEDISSNNPTSWLWDFGDGDTSSLQNPSHKYTHRGNYTVKLKTCNINGCDSLRKPNFINYNPICPCTPTRIVNVNNYINNFSIGSYSKPSTYNQNGYEFNSENQIDLLEDTQYYISISTINYSTGYCTIWIDFNMDNVFSSDELAFQSYGYYLSGTLNMPKLKQLGTTLMRVVYSDIAADAADPCTSSLTGEVEDYVVELKRPKNTKNRLSIYPNPSTGKFQIDYEMYVPEEVTIIIYNTTGQIVFEKFYGLKEELFDSFDISSYRDGIYYMSVTTPERKNNFKIFKDN